MTSEQLDEDIETRNVLLRYSFFNMLCFPFKSNSPDSLRSLFRKTVMDESSTKKRVNL